MLNKFVRVYERFNKIVAIIFNHKQAPLSIIQANLTAFQGKRSENLNTHTV